MSEPSNRHPDAYLSVADAAKLLKVGQNKVRGWIIDRELAAVNIGNKTVPRWRIPPRGLLDFLSRRSRENQEL